MTTLRLLRPKEWIRNSFVLAAALFSGTLLQPDSAVRAVLAAVFFCLASSAAYVFNDLVDREADRKHPRKRLTRPLASGAVSVRRAQAVLALLAAAAAILLCFNTALIPVGLSFLALQAAYTIKLKHVPVVDLFAIAGGFVLRVAGGSVAVGVELSFWMFITTLCLALYLAAAKRLQEFRTVGPQARGVLADYSGPVLESFMQFAAISAVVFYGLFVATVRHSLVGTTVFVLFGVFRYRYSIEKGAGESPVDVLFEDRLLLACVIGWAVSCLLLLRFMPQ